MRQLFFGLCLVVFVSSKACFTGVNLSGAEFGSAIPGRYNKDYTFPTDEEVDYFVGKGMNFFRFPILWERAEGSQNGPFNETYMSHVDSFISYATGKGAHVLLDPHNYARYYGKVIGEGVPATAFANFWTMLAKRYGSNNNVVFGLMNEPHDMKTELWLSDANTAIAAIRSAGAKNLITVPGNAWTGAWSWENNWYGTPNSQVMTGIRDPGNNYVIEVHQYLDSDSSGTSATCVSSTVGSQRLQQFTAWAKKNGVKAILAEWAGGANQVCYEAITDMLNHIDQNTDVYLGWSWWGGGPWWGNYIFRLDPQNGQDAPPMQYLVPHLHGGPCSP